MATSGVFGVNREISKGGIVGVNSLAKAGLWTANDTYHNRNGIRLNSFTLGVSSKNGWHRIDAEGNTVTVKGTIDKTSGKHTYFDDKPIYRDIETITMDSLRPNQSMVKIPKFYYKREGTGASEDPYKLWISDTSMPGFDIHPAFMKLGVEVDFFLVGAYACGGAEYDSIVGLAPKVSMDFNTAYSDIATKHGADWNMWNIYQLSAIQMLFLVEFGDPDAQTLIGTGNSSSFTVAANGATDAVYRGIHEFWGNVFQMVYGLRGYLSTTEAEILEPSGSGDFLRTGYTPPAGNESAITAMKLASSTGHSLRPVHIPDGQQAGAASFGDIYWGPAAGFVPYHGGNLQTDAGCGVFSLGLLYAASAFAWDVGVRLAKV